MSIYSEAFKYVSELYPSSVWRDKVAKMSDAQIMAIYFREKKRAAVSKKKEECHQMTLDEWIKEKEGN